MRKRRTRAIHPWPLRLTHWVNAVAIVMMVGSGWQIYNASPLFNFIFPPWATLGAWLGAGIAWHLAMMWVLVGNGLIYFAWALASGHFRRLRPPGPRALGRDLRATLTFRLAHEKGVYNAVQRLLYPGVLLAGVLVVISGFAVWKPVQFWFLSDPLGGYAASRYVHFFAMSAIVLFLVLHVVMALLVPKSIPPMITGGRVER